MKKFKLYFVQTFLLMMAQSAYAGPAGANPADALQILRNISISFPGILKFLYICSAAIGIYMIGNALYSSFKLTNNNNSAWSGRSPPQISSITSGLLIGVILTAPIFFQVAIGRAIFGGDVLTDSAFLIQTHTMNSSQKFVYEAIMNLGSIAGTLFFIAGWLKIDAYHKGIEQKWTPGAIQALGGCALFFLPNLIDMLMKWTKWNFVATMVV
ncbi:hypothetical protein R6242_18840 [Iodobacter sp. CM08]|uniref:hypothetical protein n=1 Tax=Iodobacter sp. CM08 TaxID=3085902 RepID=UPI0029815041|nr:hypothetical protein [Iodobacter sp. CM08]MDW5418626.1 hypothetical protein [Iodobacter sp. CM08]